MVEAARPGADAPMHIATHWGVYRPVVREGRLTALEPFAADPHPSAIGQGLVDAVYARSRISQPHVRRGYLEHGPRVGDNPRGGEPMVPVSWDEALDLAAHALRVTRETHGNKAIYGGSYGTRVGLVFARWHREHLRALILDGLAPPSFVVGASASRDAQRSFDAITRECMRAPECQRAFPNLAHELGEVLGRLETPETVKVADPPNAAI